MLSSWHKSWKPSNRTQGSFTSGSKSLRNKNKSIQNKTKIISWMCFTTWIPWIKNQFYLWDKNEMEKLRCTKTIVFTLKLFSNFRSKDINVDIYFWFPKCNRKFYKFFPRQDNQEYNLFKKSLWNDNFVSDTLMDV